MNENLISNGKEPATSVEGNCETVGGGVKYYTLEEVRVHNMVNDAWLIIHDNVYDVTRFIDEVRNTLFQLVTTTKALMLS